MVLSSAGVERNALIGDDEEARKKDIPIVQLNPGGANTGSADGVARHDCLLSSAVGKHGLA